MPLPPTGLGLTWIWKWIWQILCQTNELIKPNGEGAPTFWKYPWNARQASSRNTINWLSFFFINQWMNESINELRVSRTAHPPLKMGLVVSNFLTFPSSFLLISPPPLTQATSKEPLPWMLNYSNIWHFQKRSGWLSNLFYILLSIYDFIANRQIISASC